MAPAKPHRLLIAAASIVAMAQQALAELRFPQPDFESGYTPPATSVPPPRSLAWEVVDVGVLGVALALAAWLVLKRRSRLGVIYLTAACLGYFGFFRKGCVCPIGSIQNITAGLCDPSFAVPLTVVAFFALPLAAALIFGRVFCAGVCPLGAIQDLVAVHPVRVPEPIAEALGSLRYVYLAAAILLTSLGAGFLICRYDPFVAFFRMDGKLPMLLYGAALLLLGVFVARPYCRFLCPYGVLLGWLSRLSWRHASVTPAQCIQCRLCEHSCPFDAIRFPAPAPSLASLERGRKELVFLLLLLPVLVAGGAWLGHATSRNLAGLHPTVSLSRRIQLEADVPETPTTKATDAFRTSGRTAPELHADARAIEAHFATRAAVAGALLAFLLGLKLMALTRRPARSDYETDRSLCLSCARCFRFCPVRPGGEVPPEFLTMGNKDNA
ncbi:MAG TPA: 4Fe-4S binding protein [Verrucomicrobiae bacterium]|nr:4Fe-4S binding protein [Verrucomicrobiae bacterium]